jgi:hypothetical protein
VTCWLEVKGAQGVFCRLRRHNRNEESLQGHIGLTKALVLPRGALLSTPHGKNSGNLFFVVGIQYSDQTSEFAGRDAFSSIKKK